MDHFYKPKLRNINVERTIYQNEPVFILQDGLNLTEAVILLPQYLGPLAVLCDGTRTIPEIEFNLVTQYGLEIPQASIEQLLQQFDQALLLESENFTQARQKAVEAFRAAPNRQPALAGSSYPADPEDLRQMLQRYLDEAGDVTPTPATIRAIISPHIDYQRGGPVYAQVWATAVDAVREADLIILIGTDHNGSYGTITLTPQNYASPLGVMPTDTNLVEQLAGVIGSERAFADELHHVGEHSLELDLVWLQYMRAEKPCPIVPILSGSFRHFMMDEADIAEDTAIDAFVEALREIMAKQRTVIVASGDLAHMGPAFDGDPVDPPGQTQMRNDDRVLIETLCQGRADRFFNFMKAGQYERNVCGLSPFYFTMSALGQTQGHKIGYDLCPADFYGTSFVSICGLVWE